MERLLINFTDNPILTRELRRRMRGRALIFSIIGYIALMTVATLLVLFANAPSLVAKVNTEMLSRLTQTGSSLFRWISTIQILLVLIIAPTITAGMTTGEKERKTFDFLRVTTITPWMYVLGCFLSTVFYVMLALTCAFPLLSLTFVYGGVTAGELFAMFGVLLGGSLVLSSFGLYVSSVWERTRTAQGIIVFTIFAMLFGGFYIYNQLLRIFGGAAVTAATGQAATGAEGGAVVTSGSAFLFGTSVPYWMLAALVFLLITWVFLLLATRKLFDPDNTRAFSHWQFLLFAAILIVPQLSFIGGMVASEPVTLLFLSTGMVLLFIAVQCFAVGRMEVGDEIWHLKRMVPILRPIDQTLPYLILLGVLWALAIGLFQKFAASHLAPAGVFDSFMKVSVSCYAFMVAVGRLMTATAVGRSGAARGSLIVVIALWVVIPLAGYALYETFDTAVGLGLLYLSPFALLIQSVSEPQLFAAAPKWGTPVGVVTIFYAAAALVVFVVSEVKRFRRWGRFNYHYDMPAA